MRMKSINLSTRGILYLGFGLIIIIIIVVSLTSYLSTNNMGKFNELVISASTRSDKLSELKADFNGNRALILEMIMSNKTSNLERIKSEIDTNAINFDERLSFLSAEYQNNPVEYQKINDLKKDLETYRANYRKQIALVSDEKTFEAKAISDNENKGLFKKMSAVINELDSQESKKYKQLILDDKRNEHTSIIVIIFVGLGAVVVSYIMSSWIIKMLRKINNEINDGIIILGTSASEILATATEVSTGATETATAMTETTTTIEEVRQTALLTNQKANNVVESSQKSTDAAQQGKRSVADTINGMKRITQQMNVVSESVVKLSEQSRTIGEITLTVNDLADQSNLLAVNAAIEAAKAGEQGRGFAVVAQEIRSLAEQSKSAASQIKETLNIIQKSMNQAVNATDEGVKAVESGRLLAEQSGEVIRILSENVNEAAQSAMLISSSSQQQMAGMNQIVPAIENIRQASEQNVIGTKQTQMAAKSLNELSQNLKKITEKYKV